MKRYLLFRLKLAELKEGLSLVRSFDELASAQSLASKMKVYIIYDEKEKRIIEAGKG